MCAYSGLRGERKGFSKNDSKARKHLKMMDFTTLKIEISIWHSHVFKSQSRSGGHFDT